MHVQEVKLFPPKLTYENILFEGGGKLLIIIKLVDFISFAQHFLRNAQETIYLWFRQPHPQLEIFICVKGRDVYRRLQHLRATARSVHVSTSTEW